jgi:hypothetical protein
MNSIFTFLLNLIYWGVDFIILAFYFSIVWIIICLVAYALS